jgi:hypothetical protein
LSQKETIEESYYQLEHCACYESAGREELTKAPDVDKKLMLPDPFTLAKALALALLSLALAQ